MQHADILNPSNQVKLSWDSFRISISVSFRTYVAYCFETMKISTVLGSTGMTVLTIFIPIESIPTIPFDYIPLRNELDHSTVSPKNDPDHLTMYDHFTKE